MQECCLARLGTTVAACLACRRTRRIVGVVSRNRITFFTVCCKFFRACAESCGSCPAVLLAASDRTTGALRGARGAT
jgi:hypothetical protein